MWNSLVQFSPSVMSDSLWPHGLQHTRLPCPSPTPGACSNSYPSSWWCHPTNHLDLCHPLLLPSIFPSIRVFSNESVICLIVSETLREPEMTCPAWLCLPSMGWLAGRPDPEVVPQGVRALDCFGLILNLPETPWAVLIELLFPCQLLIIATWTVLILRFVFCIASDHPWLGKGWCPQLTSVSVFVHNSFLTLCHWLQSLACLQCF